MTGLQIRQAGIEDALLIAGLNLAVHEVHVAGRPDIFKPMTLNEDLVRLTAQRLADPAAYFLIAEVDGEAVGYLYALLKERPENPFVYSTRYLFVDQVSVHPAHRSKGCGEALMAHITTLAKELGAARVTLDVWAFNERAVDFYKRLGYTIFDYRMEMRVE